MDLGISGLASGFDWRSLVEQSAIEQRGTSYGGLKTQLNALQNRAGTPSEPELFIKRTTSVDPSGDDGELDMRIDKRIAEMERRV